MTTLAAPMLNFFTVEPDTIEMECEDEMSILTALEVKEYKKLYRHYLTEIYHDRESAHIKAWHEYRGTLIMHHPVGWWMLETRAAVMSEIAEIEGSVKR